MCFSKERLKINKIAKFESDLLKNKDDIALKSCKDDTDICISSQKPPQIDLLNSSLGQQ